MTTAVLLAAGAGRRLWPLSDTHPKAALPLANRPILHHLLDACTQAGLNRSLVVAGPHAAALERLAGNRQGVEVLGLADERGPAWSLRRLVESRELDGDLLILHADVLFHADDIKALVTAGRSGSAVLASALDQRTCDPALPIEDGRDWICCEIEGHRLIRFLGHHREPQTHRCAGAFYLQSADLDVVQRPGTRFEGLEVGSMPPDEVPVEQLMNDLLASGKAVTAVTCCKGLVDIDKPYHLLTANDLAIRRLIAGLPERDLAPDAMIDPIARISGKVRLGARSRIEGAVIVDGDLVAGDDVVIADGAIIRGPLAVGDRTVIRDYCHVTGPSSLGADCVIGHAAEFQGLAMDHVYLYHLMEVYGVLGSSVDIGAGTVFGTLRFDDRPQPQRIAGRREIPNDHSTASIIGAFSRTGVNVTLAPGVKIGAYSAVGPGVLVTEDVPSRTMVTLKQELTRRSWGPGMHGW